MKDYVKKVLRVRKYKAGYEIRTELIDGAIFGCDDYEMKSAYTPEGWYIGNSKRAYFLCKKMGIKPELASLDHSVCSIGWCEQEQRWYGWSHRAIYGFGIGSECKKGDCGYEPTNPQDLLEDCKRFWLDPDAVLIEEALGVSDPKGCEEGMGVVVKYKKKNVAGKWYENSSWEPYPQKWGKGEWVAQTLEDAKQMAIDFVEGVS